MFNRILVPLDGSKLAERAIPHACAFARAFGGSLILLQILDPSPYRESATATEPFTWQIRKAEGDVYLQNLATRLRNAGFQVESSLREGKAAENIIDFAHSENADLLVLTTHGVSGLSRWNMSSVVEKVIEKVYLPLLLVRSYQSQTGQEEQLDQTGRGEPAATAAENAATPSAYQGTANIAAPGGASSDGSGSVASGTTGAFKTTALLGRASDSRRIQADAFIPVTGEEVHYRRVLMPIDCSRRAECSLPAGITLGQWEQQAYNDQAAQAAQASESASDGAADIAIPGVESADFALILASVIHPPEIPLQPPYPDEFNQLSEQYVRLSQQAVENTFHDLQSRLPVNTETRIIVSDSVSAALHDLADKESADLVILCAHGTTGRSTWPYGSVANNFVRYSDKPVLVIQDVPRSQFQPTAAEIAAQKYGRR